MKTLTTPRIRALVASTAVAASAMTASAALAKSEGHHIERQPWSFAGFLGQYDTAQLRRGFEVYSKVCSGCHGLKRVNFRNLVQPGGPEFPEEAVKALAAEWPNQIPELNDAGESAVVTKDKDGKTTGFKYVTRAPRLADPILGPHPNDAAARAAFGGALPPDLSVIAKARNVEYEGPVWWHPVSMLRDIVTGYQEGGPDYIHALMNGYADQAPPYKRDEAGRLHPVPESEVGDEKSVERCATVVAGEAGKPDTCNAMQPGMNYNSVFAGHQIAMGKPLADGLIPYDKGPDGKPNAPETVDQYARDVASFLAWAADPSLDSRKKIGWQVMLYMLITTLLLYLGKKRLWSQIAH